MELEKLLGMQKQLMEKVPHNHVIKPEHQGLVVAGCGIIEETMEFLNAIGFKSWRPSPLPREAQLEELTDILFFYLELIILSGFSLEQIEQEYKRKHSVNLDRYRRLREGDTSWDKRNEGGL